MKNRREPPLLALLQLILWFSIIWTLKSVHQTETSKVGKKLMQVGEPSLWPENIAHYFQPKPQTLSKLDTLFYEFSPIVVDHDDYNSIRLVSANQSDHENTTLQLNNVQNLLDNVVRREGFKLFAFNMLISNKIGLLRSLPDTRPQKCPKIEQEIWTQQERTTGKVSIIICYYNEAPSALLRTVHSILKRSRLDLIEEIIIIDDYSESGYDIEQIQPYVEDKLVRVIRTQRREGLIRARQFGADIARGDILVFLDSHVEANVGWLEPLVRTISESPSTIACPMIDLINAETLIYTASPMVKGGLSWSLHFKWDSVPANKLRSPQDFTKPIDTPTMAGGLYAVNREYFYHLGAYDLGMNLWGGENVELSLRTWMCGGRIVILPCSRLGHIFRKRRPYGPEPGEPDSLLYNSHRTARVWLDKYLSKFYGHQPDAASMNSGDVSERIELRSRLKCNSFEWYMENVYPNLRGELDISANTESTDRPKLFETKARPLQ